MAHRCAVLGSPIAHSLSPVMHRAAYGRLGLAWTYDAYDVDAAALPGFLAGLDAAWRGLSLTMPLKRAVLPLLDELSATARESGAVNTVLLDARGASRGDNTDVPGIVSALREQGVTAVQRATVLGTGATATSALVALQRLGLRHAVLCGRDPIRAGRLADWARARGIAADAAPLDPPARAGELVVSTVPASAVAPWAESLVRDADVVLDAVYRPWPTPLLAAAAVAGLRTVTGIDLLAHQAVLQVLAMTGRGVPVDVLRDAAQAALGSAP